MTGRKIFTITAKHPTAQMKQEKRKKKNIKQKNKRTRPKLIIENVHTWETKFSFMASW
jgi:hypothetical protein